MLRHEAEEGLRELSSRFQLVLFSNYTPALTFEILKVLNTQQKHFLFDAVYCSPHTLSNQKRTLVLNQVYLDFEVIWEKESLDSSKLLYPDLSLDLEFTDKIEREVLVVAALELENTVIKDCPK